MIDLIVSEVRHGEVDIAVMVDGVSIFATVPVGKWVNLPADLLDPDASGVDDLSDPPGHLIASGDTLDQ